MSVKDENMGKKEGTGQGVWGWNQQGREGEGEDGIERRKEEREIGKKKGVEKGEGGREEKKWGQRKQQRGNGGRKKEKREG